MFPMDARKIHWEFITKTHRNNLFEENFIPNINDIKKKRNSILKCVFYNDYEN